MIVGGAKSIHVGQVGDQTIQYGFTTSGLKASLFSRMSPNAKVNGAPVFAELHKAARTQASSNNIGSAQTVSPPATRQTQAANATSGNGSAANRNARSPFRDAMGKGILSGAGLLTH